MVRAGGLSDGLFPHRAANVDHVVGDDSKPDPPLHSDVALVAATVEAVAPLDDADASLASGPPFLAVAEPALLLFAFSLRAFCGAIGDADAFDTHRFGGRLILGGVEPGVGCHEARRAPEPGLVDFDGCDQQVGIIGPLIIDFVVDHDLIFGLLQLHYLAEFVGLAGLTLANDFG